MQTIKIYDKEYPAYQTMGAMLAFKNNQGKDVSEISAAGIDDMIRYLYFVVRSACKREGKEFAFETIEDFADGMSLEDFTAWSTSLGQNSENKPEGKGKTQGE